MPEARERTAMTQSEVNSCILRRLDRLDRKLDAKLDKILYLAIAVCALAWIDAALIFALLIIRW